MRTCKHCYGNIMFPINVFQIAHLEKNCCGYKNSFPKNTETFCCGNNVTNNVRHMFPAHCLVMYSIVIFWLLGSERNYVILSLVRSLPEKEIERNPSRSWLREKLGFITDEHQINVALTRAKRGLCIIGKNMQSYMLYFYLIEHTRRNRSPQHICKLKILNHMIDEWLIR